MVERSRVGVVARGEKQPLHLQARLREMGEAALLRREVFEAAPVTAPLPLPDDPRLSFLIENWPNMRDSGAPFPRSKWLAAARFLATEHRRVTEQGFVAGLRAAGNWYLSAIVGEFSYTDALGSQISVH